MANLKPAYVDLASGELVEPRNNDKLINDPDVTVDSITELQESNISKSVYLRTKTLKLLGYNEPGDNGGGTVYWDADRDKQDHDGGEFISPTHSIGTFGDPTDDNWHEPDPDDTGTGVWVRDIGTFVSPEMYGCFGDGVTNDAFGFTACCENQNNVWGSGHYAGLEHFSIEKETFNLQGDGSAILDFSDDTSVDYDLRIEGSREEMSGISSNLSKEDREVSFSSSHNLQEGDLFHFHDPNTSSWSVYRDYYKKGEICKVQEVIDSTTVQVFNPLYDNYTAADVDVYKINPVKTNLEGFNVITNEGQGVSVRYGENVSVSKIDITGIMIRGLEIDTCYAVNIGSILISQDGTSASPNPTYGINYGSCQNITIDGAFLDTYSDSIESSRGSDFPTRNITISNVFASNNISQHGFAEFTKVSNCTADQIWVGGNNGEVYDCTILSELRLAREGRGMNWKAARNTIYGFTTGQPLNLDQPNDDQFQYGDNLQKLLLKDNEIRGGRIVINSGSNRSYNVDVEIVENTDISNIDDDSGSDTFGYYPDQAIDLNSLTCNSLILRDNIFYGWGEIIFSQSDDDIFVDISGNTWLKATRAPIIRGNGNQIVFFGDNKVIDNHRSTGGAASSNANVLFSSIDQLYIENNKLGDTTNNTNGNWIGVVSVNTYYLTNNSTLNQESKEIVGTSSDNIQPGFTGQGHVRSGVSTIPSGNDRVEVTGFDNFNLNYSITVTGTHEEVAGAIVPIRGGSGFTIATSDFSNVTADRDVYWSLEI